MGMITRYKKAGGFIQLLKLLETCGPKKQEQLLKNVQTEDPRWSEAIQQKMLSLDKIFSWPEGVLAEIFTRVQELTLAIAMHGFKEEDWVKASQSMSHLNKRRIEDLKKSKNPTPAEITTAYMKIIEDVRDLIVNGYIKLDQFAPDLVIPEDYEEILDSQAFPDADDSAQSSTSTDSSTGLDFSKADQMFTNKSTGTPKAENLDANTQQLLTALKNEVIMLRKENTHLKQELNTMKNKVVQVKKLLAA